MQRILDQELDGSQEQAETIAIYTWEKDEIAWYFCNIYKDVFKVQFTGKHWLSGNKWRFNKIYQYRYLESSSSKDLSRKGLDEDGISHGQEDIFFTTKEEAIEKGLKWVNRHFDNAKDEFTKDINKLNLYSEENA